MADCGRSSHGARPRAAPRSYGSIRCRCAGQKRKPMGGGWDYDRKGCGVHWTNACRRCAFFSLALVARGSRELFTLAVVALALGVAFGSAKLFGVSFALGAFFAGVVINESDLSHRATKDLQPLQDAFTVLFFVAMGMLFDPSILVRQPLQVLAVLAIIMFGKSLAALALFERWEAQPEQRSLSPRRSLRSVNFLLSLPHSA